MPSTKRLTTRATVGVAASVFVLGCAGAKHEPPATPPQQQTAAPSPASQNDASSQTSSDTVPQLENVPPDVVVAAVDRALAEGEPMRLERARTALLEYARKVSAESWRDDHRGRLVSLNTSRGFENVKPQQLEAQLAQWQLERLSFALSQLERVRDSRVRAFAFETLEDTRQPAEHRRLAAELLSRTVEVSEQSERARLDALAKQIPEPAPEAGTVANVNLVVAGLRGQFRSCYQAWLKAGNRTEHKLSVWIRVGSDGRVSSVDVSGDAPESLGMCVQDVALTAKFAPPEGGKAVIHVPVTFVLK
jgi:hypothetical protein